MLTFIWGGHGRILKKGGWFPDRDLSFTNLSESVEDPWVSGLTSQTMLWDEKKGAD